MTEQKPPKVSRIVQRTGVLFPSHAAHVAPQNTPLHIIRFGEHCVTYREDPQNPDTQGIILRRYFTSELFRDQAA